MALTWTYSGLLSMGPFNWFSSPGITRQQREAFTGGPLRGDLLTLDNLRSAVAEIERSFGSGRTAGFVKELEVAQVRGEPYWLAYRAPSDKEAVQWMHAGLRPRAPRPLLERQYISAVHPETDTFAQFDEERMNGTRCSISRALRCQASQSKMRCGCTSSTHTNYDLRGARSLPVLRVRYADPEHTWLYIDPARGGIVLKTDDTRRLRRWLYQGLHSLDFPLPLLQASALGHCRHRVEHRGTGP